MIASGTSTLLARVKLPKSAMGVALLEGREDARPGDGFLDRQKCYETMHISPKSA
jgi:hypothetical protein